MNQSFLTQSECLFLNRFNLVQRTMQACTALAFNLRRKTEFLVALADYSVKCFDAGKEKFRVLNAICVGMKTYIVLGLILNIWIVCFMEIILCNSCHLSEK